MQTPFFLCLILTPDTLVQCGEQEFKIILRKLKSILKNQIIITLFVDLTLPGLTQTIKLPVWDITERYM